MPLNNPLPMPRLSSLPRKVFAFKTKANPTTIQTLTLHTLQPDLDLKKAIRTHLHGIKVKCIFHDTAICRVASEQELIAFCNNIKNPETNNGLIYK